jgi:hypothetical protein
MDFAGGYKEHNREMNDLYLCYSQLAKILAVGGQNAKKGFPFEHRFDLHEAASVFNKFENKPAEARCYQNLGCLIVLQNFKSESNEAKKRILQAIEIQDNIIQSEE